MAPKTKRKSAPTTKPVSEEAQQFPTVNWPPLTPLPSSDLSIKTVVPSQILTISSFWPSKLCNTYISFLSSLPLTTTPAGPKRGLALRVNDRFQISDPTFAEKLWSGTALKELVLEYAAAEPGIWGGEVVGLNPNIRVYRYRPGQFFDRHFDDSNDVAFATSSPRDAAEVKAKTTWTLLLYLTDRSTGCVGGETVFYPEAKKKGKGEEPVVCELEVGMMLLHRHGRECMLHEGREVTQGEKWVLRSDICVKR
ncbi:hypothetical protein LTS18_009480 [Coniosporium uncinatum]|uniref:Uncharacterized protein n=1 Tax=Coniosporium uncinatum TaxID=93489 RepID=A0ACC3DMI7_9PEZI|nr:hypothetical protein LTS18_009480 [Coniosporium uncinatum]